MTHPGIWILDATGKTLFADDCVADILGAATRSEIIGQISTSYIFPDDVATVHRILESKKRGDSSPFECRLRRKDGSPVRVTMRAAPMHSGRGEFKGLVSIVSPIPA